MKIAFYNVENLFDTLDDKFVNDNSFLPESGLKWNEKRYILKLQRIARVLQAIDKPMPFVLGLAEVENRKVLEDIVGAIGLTEEEIGIIHGDSPDERGIDVGFLYRKEFVSRTEHFSHSVVFDNELSDRTRDILQIKVYLKNGKLVHFFVNHWPSRKDGVKISISRRIAASRVLEKNILRLMDTEEDPNIIVMGDFNCDPESSPIRNILDKERSGTGTLYNLSWQKHKEGKGSMNYRGKWLMFDQILVSEAISKGKAGIMVLPESFSVFSESWMLFYNPKYKDYRPNKTSGGRKYHGGFSDHLPVYIRVKTDSL